MNWTPSDERFVDIPGIVEIRLKSDDPEYYHEPIDLYDEQKNGLPDHYCMKDEQTTEQAWFYCNICKVDLRSVDTLRWHCKGNKHVRKAIQKKMEFQFINENQKKMEYSIKLKKGKADGASALSQKFKVLMIMIMIIIIMIVILTFLTY